MLHWLDRTKPIWFLRWRYPTLGTLVRAGMKRHKAPWAVLSIDRASTPPSMVLKCLPTLDDVYEVAGRLGQLPKEDPNAARWAYRQTLPPEDNPAGYVLVMTLGSGAWFTLAELDRFKLGSK